MCVATCADLWKWFEFCCESFQPSSSTHHTHPLVLFLQNALIYSTFKTPSVRFIIFSHRHFWHFLIQRLIAFTAQFRSISLGSSNQVNHQIFDTFKHTHTHAHTLLHKSTNFKLINNWNAEKMNFMFLNHTYPYPSSTYIM